jgi:methyl-accepting chemotaxis protein
VAITEIQEGARRNLEATRKAVSSIEESTDLANQSGDAVSQLAEEARRLQQIIEMMTSE